MGLTLNDALPWIQSVNIVAQMEKLDTKSASLYVAQELALNRQLCGIRGQIQKANQELALINMAIIQKQQALTWYSNQQLQQPNNGNGKIPSSLVNPQQLGNSNNPGPGSISVNNLIRLNMLKTNTTNMLNRMGA